MKSFLAQLKITAGLLGLCLGLMACAPASMQANLANTSSGATVTQAAVSCSTKTDDLGLVYDEKKDGSSYSTLSFEQRVKGLVSATLDPSEIGSISGEKNFSRQYISMAGSFKFDNSGNLQVADTSVQLLINDSLVGTKDAQNVAIEPYSVGFSAATSGSIDRAAKTFKVIFQDSYGSITFQGTYDASMARGRVDYANTQAVSGSTPASGVLGAFYISTCALIQ